MASVENTIKICDSNHGLSYKKMHEIALLAPVIQKIYQETECDLVVDIGSGLGYLPNLLHENYKFSVLGLESSKKYVQIAQQNQKKQQPKFKNNVKFYEMYVNKNSETSIKKAIEENFPHKKQICVTGLHACADLSIEVLDLFINMKTARALVIMPCCYHRIRVAREDTFTTHFENFPASNTLKDLFQKYDAYSFIRQPFLRLACQKTSESFVSMCKEEHLSHSLQCMHRAILQLVVEMKNCSVRRLKRKSGKSDATDIDEAFQIYLNNLKNTHKLVVNPDQKNEIKISDEAFLFKMHEKWIEHKGACWLVEVLMGLQTAIQSICENVILLDRVEFLKEKGFHCYNRKITNDFISPRCWALIAKKH